MENKTSFFGRLLEEVKDIVIKKPLRFFKYMVPFVALLALIRSDVQISTILCLTHELCSIGLFLFILVGLACVFNALRVKKAKSKYGIFTLMTTFVVVGLCGYLIYVYNYSLINQVPIDAARVNKGLIELYVFAGLYLLAIIQFIRALFIKETE